jgi:osmotically-inducible protein OsmY
MSSKRYDQSRPNALPLALILAVGLAGSPVMAAQHPVTKAAPQAGTAEKVTYSDEQLEARLTTAYKLNRHLYRYPLAVEVTDGVAQVSGQVDNAVEHDLAIEIANGVDGISRVDNRIRVTPELAQNSQEPIDQASPGFARKVSDATTTASVKMRLLWNRHTDGLDIKVATSNGKVTLEGLVDSAVTRDLAGEIAANTHDVREVDNRLRLRDATVQQPTVGDKVGSAVDKAGETISDTWITTKVYASLDNSDEVESTGIKVSTTKGVVTLEGSVGTEAERLRAPEITADVAGVHEIDNRLRVDPRLTQQDPDASRY